MFCLEIEQTIRLNNYGFGLKILRYNFLLFGLSSFPRRVRPRKQAPVHLFLEEVTVHAGHQVSMVVDFNCTDCWGHKGYF